MTDNQRSRFILYRRVDEIAMKDKLNNTWYTFQNQEEADAKIKELEEEQLRKGV